MKYLYNKFSEEFLNDILFYVWVLVWIMKIEMQDSHLAELFKKCSEIIDLLKQESLEKSIQPNLKNKFIIENENRRSLYENKGINTLTDNPIDLSFVYYENFTGRFIYENIFTIFIVFYYTIFLIKKK